jgi:hypothetical protein
MAPGLDMAVTVCCDGYSSSQQRVHHHGTGSRATVAWPLPGGVHRCCYLRAQGAAQHYWSQHSPGRPAVQASPKVAVLMHALTVTEFLASFTTLLGVRAVPLPELQHAAAWPAATPCLTELYAGLLTYIIRQWVSCGFCSGAQVAGAHDGVVDWCTACWQRPASCAVLAVQPHAALLSSCTHVSGVLHVPGCIHYLALQHEASSSEPPPLPRCCSMSSRATRT